MKSNRVMTIRRIFNKPAVIAGIIAVAAVGISLVLAACGASAPKDKPWDQQFNDEVSDIDVDLRPQRMAPAFEFYLQEPQPRFSMVLCLGESSDSRVSENNWYTFSNEAMKWVSGTHRPEFTDQGIAGGKHLTRVMMSVNLPKEADPAAATEAARKIADVMRSTSPCK